MEMTTQRKAAVRGRRRLLLSCLAVSVLAAAVIGTRFTGAWLSDGNRPVKNSFIPAAVTCEIHESFEENVKSEIRVQNAGSTDAYIRAAVICQYGNARGEITAPAALPPVTLGDGWFAGQDGYYYYQSKLSPADSTGCLFEEPLTDDKGLQITILAEAIQAQGEAADGKPAVETAWPVTVSPSGILSERTEQGGDA